MTEQEIKNLAKAVFEEGAKSAEDKTAATVDEKLKGVNGKLADLTEKIGKLEAAPASGAFETKADFGMHLGANVNEVVETLRSKGLFQNKELSTEENRANAALFGKWAVSLFKSMAMRDPSVYREFCKAANVEGTDANGGYLVPKTVAAELIKSVRDDSFALRECTTFTMSAPEVSFPAENGLATAAFVGENTAATAANPTFNSVVIKALKAMSLTDGVSGELLQDSVVSFVGILVDQMTYALSQLIDNTVINGISGDTANFQGILNAATGIATVQLAAKKTFADVGYDELADLVGKLKASDAARAKFCLSGYGLTVLRKVKTADGVPLFASPVAGDSATLLGKPYFVSEFMPGVADAATAAKNVLAFGDWKKYYIGLMPGSLAIEADPYSNFDKDTIRYRMKMRIGGNPVRKSAFAVLKTGAAS